MSENCANQTARAVIKHSLRKSAGGRKSTPSRYGCLDRLPQPQGLPKLSRISAISRLLFSDHEERTSVETRAKNLGTPSIFALLRRFRLVPIDQRVTNEYSRIRSLYPSLARGDALIGASALARKLPVLTLNLRHFRLIQGLVLLPVEVPSIRSRRNR